MALENITVANSFDYPNETIEGKMAVALLTRADQLVFNNVRLTGWQDTLQADGRLCRLDIRQRTGCI